MNKKTLLITSALISLTLFNVTNVKAEETFTEPQTQNNEIEKNQPTTKKKQTPDSTQSEEGQELQNKNTEKNQEQFNEIYEKLHTLLSEEKKIIMNEIVSNEDEATLLFKEAIVSHELSEFGQAIVDYEKYLANLEDVETTYPVDATNLEKTNQVIDLVKLFIQVAEENILLLEYDFTQDNLIEAEEQVQAGEQSINEEIPENENKGIENDTAEVEESPKEESPEQADVVKESEPVKKEGTREPEETETKGSVERKTKSSTQQKVQSQTFSVRRQQTSDPILNEKSINYRAILTRPTDGINTKPWGVSGYETIRLVDDWVGKSVKITRETTTPRTTWAYVEVIGTDVSGWIDKEGLAIESITSTNEVRYDAALTRSNDGINTKPFGTEGYETIRTVDNWVGQKVRVTEEAITPRATWAYIEVIGTNIAGWIDTAGLEVVETVVAEQSINYYGKLARRSDGINTKPWGVSGYETIRMVDDWVGKSVKVTREAITPRATWSYVEVLGTDVSGWIDKKGLTIESITSTNEVRYDAELTRSNDGINTKPFGTEGYETIRTVDNWVGKTVRVTKEATTPRATWAYIEVIGTNVTGWIDRAGLKKVETVLAEQSINYYGKIARRSDGINTKPWGVSGYETIQMVDDWVGKSVKVTREAITPRATWSYVEVLGTDVSGWIDKVGIKIEEVSSAKNTNYKAYLTRPTDGINTKPFGTEGYKTIRLVGDLVGSEVRVTKEAVTPRSTWSYITVIGTDISGWIDKTGTSLGSVAKRFTYYDQRFNEVLNKQMNTGMPKTDRYGDIDNDGDRWDDAKRNDVSYYLNPENFANVQNGSTTQYIDRLQISTAGLNVRVTPPSGTIIGVATRNEVYDILNESNGWFKIEFDGQYGWVSSAYVSPISQILYQNEIDDPEMLQFLSLSNPSGISAKDMNKELEGKGILEGTGQAFIDASQRYNINEIYLASHAILETGNGASELATGVEVNGVTVYNMFGIGAYDGMAVEAGSQRAYEEGWNTPEKAIIGGAQFIASSYINSPTYKQDTLYKMRWNPANPTVHQYATDIGWAVKQTRSLDKILELSDKYNLTLKFDIPVYK